MVTTGGIIVAVYVVGFSVVVLQLVFFPSEKDRREARQTWEQWRAESAQRRAAWQAERAQQRAAWQAERAQQRAAWQAEREQRRQTWPARRQERQARWAALRAATAPLWLQYKGNALILLHPRRERELWPAFWRAFVHPFNVDIQLAYRRLLEQRFSAARPAVDAEPPSSDTCQ